MTEPVATRPRREYHHGRTPAAWVGTITAMVGFVLGALGAVMGPQWVLIWVGVALVVLGGVLGWALSLAGFGENHG